MGGATSWRSGVPRPGDAAGDPGMLDLFVDGDYAASLRVRLQTERGAGPAGTKVLVLVGNMQVFSIDGAGNVSCCRHDHRAAHQEEGKRGHLDSTDAGAL